LAGLLNYRLSGRLMEIFLSFSLWCIVSAETLANETADTHKQTAGQPMQKDDDEANLRVSLGPEYSRIRYRPTRTTRITDDTSLAGDETKSSDEKKKRSKINRNKQSKCRIDFLLFTSTAENSGDRKCSKNSPAPVAQHQKVDPVRLAPMISGPTPVSFLCSFPLTIGCVSHQSVSQVIHST
jgi:hypothetical protein